MKKLNAFILQESDDDGEDVIVESEEEEFDSGYDTIPLLMSLIRLQCKMRVKFIHHVT